jgi:hypothetical protein
MAVLLLLSVILVFPDPAWNTVAVAVTGVPPIE